jgi:hypothetical protein
MTRYLPRIGDLVLDSATASRGRVVAIIGTTGPGGGWYLDVADVSREQAIRGVAPSEVRRIKAEDARPVQ